MEGDPARAHDRPMETVNDNQPPTGTAPPYRRPPRLTRSTSDKVVGGLAGGLGTYFGVDPVVFRIAFVVLTLAGGSGILLYLLGWAVIPDDHGGAALSRFGRERNQKLLAAVLIGGAILILTDQLTSRHNGDVPIGLVLVGIGALVLWARRDDHGDLPPGGGLPPDPPRPSGGPSYEPPAPYAPPPPPAPMGQLAPTEPPTTGPSEPPTTEPAEPAQPGGPVDPAASAEPTLSFAAPTRTMAPPPRPVAPPKPRKPRSVLVPVTLSLLAILAGGLALAHVSATTGVALALLLTGAALMVGAWRGRAKWLTPVGVLLSLALAVVSILDVPVRGGTGDIAYRPRTVDEVRSPYRLAAGQLVVDLSAVDLTGRDLTVVASVAAGDLQVIVPANATVDVDAHVGAGNLRLLGRPGDDGLDVGRQLTEPGSTDGGHLVLRARTGFGSVEVRRAQA